MPAATARRITTPTWAEEAAGPGAPAVREPDALEAMVVLDGITALFSGRTQAMAAGSAAVAVVVHVRPIIPRLPHRAAAVWAVAATPARRTPMHCPTPAWMGQEEAAERQAGSRLVMFPT